MSFHMLERTTHVPRWPFHSTHPTFLLEGSSQIILESCQTPHIIHHWKDEDISDDNHQNDQIHQNRQIHTIIIVVVIIITILARSNIMKAGIPRHVHSRPLLPATPSPYNGHTLNLKERSFSRPVRSSLYYITTRALLYGEGHTFS